MQRSALTCIAVGVMAAVAEVPVIVAIRRDRESRLVLVDDKGVAFTVCAAIASRWSGCSPGRLRAVAFANGCVVDYCWRLG